MSWCLLCNHFRVRGWVWPPLPPNRIIVYAFEAKGLELGFALHVYFTNLQLIVVLLACVFQDDKDVHPLLKDLMNVEDIIAHTLNFNFNSLT